MLTIVRPALLQLPEYRPPTAYRRVLPMSSRSWGLVLTHKTHVRASSTQQPAGLSSPSVSFRPSFHPPIYPLLTMRPLDRGSHLCCGACADVPLVELMAQGEPRAPQTKLSDHAALRTRRPQSLRRPAMRNSA